MRARCFSGCSECTEKKFPFKPYCLLFILIIMSYTYKDYYFLILGLNIRSVLQEDERGSVEESIRRLVMDEKRQRRQQSRPAKIRLGIVRFRFFKNHEKKLQFKCQCIPTLDRPLLRNFEMRSASPKQRK